MVRLIGHAHLPGDEAPPPPRRLIRKSTVTARVNAAGKTAAVWAVFQSNPLALLQWTSPDWPNVYADDEGLLAVLNAVGCTPEEIAAITAA